ncbi:MAG: MATE family efflux transporter [Clostridia bacterium]|nr:MATE family efflux transporter [Clostridia bacterium]
MIIKNDILKLTAPIVAEQFFIMSMGVVNTIMAANIGKEAISAIGMIDSISNIFIAFFSSLAVGSTVVVAYYTGQRNSEAANETAKQALFSGLILSLLITVFTWLFRSQIIHVLFGAAEKTVFDNALLYMTITLAGYPLLSITSMAFGVLRGAGDTGTPMKLTICMNIINVILSYFLIYGLNIKNVHFNLHIPGMGVTGAALAITISRAVGALLILIALLKGSKIIRLTNMKSFKISFDLQKSIFNIGIPAGLDSLVFNGGKLITQVFIVGLGTASIAANSISGSVFNLVNIPGIALSIAATTLVGQYMGKGDSEQAKDSIVYITKLSSICLAVVCALILPFTKQIAALYTSDQEIISITSVLILHCALATPLIWSVSFVLPSGLRGAGDTKYAMVISLIGMWFFRIVLGYLFAIPLKLGVAGIWMGMYIDWLVRSILFIRRLRSGKWKQAVVIREASEAL